MDYGCWITTSVFRPDAAAEGVRLSAGGRNNAIQDRLAGRCQLEFRQQLREATQARVGPAQDLGDDARQGEGRQLLTKRFQHAHENRLPAGAAERLAGAARLASGGRPVVSPTMQIQKRVDRNFETGASRCIFLVLRINAVRHAIKRGLQARSLQFSPTNSRRDSGKWKPRIRFAARSTTGTRRHLQGRKWICVQLGSSEHSWAPS